MMIEWFFGWEPDDFGEVLNEEEIEVILNHTCGLVVETQVWENAPNRFANPGLDTPASPVVY